MAENDIKSRIVLEGEKEYKQALKDANRELKTLKSALKAETAELGSNATAQQKNEVRIKNLQKQIKEQEKVVKTYTKALEEVKEKYGDNEDEVAKWETKLNNARATLANMRNDLDGVGDSMKDLAGDANMATVASKSAADAIGSLADIGGTISDSIEGIFTGMVSMVKGAISDIWADVVDLAARSNNLVDLAGFWNTDVTTIQKYKGAVESASASLEDLSSIVTKINAGDAKKIAELTGVSGANYKDQWEYAMAVMDAMSKMSKDQRNGVGFEIFGGRQATKAFDLLNDWQTVLDNLDKFDVEKGGYGQTEEQMLLMSTLYDKINAVKASWQSLKDMATVRLFGSLSLDLTSNAQGILDGFLAYFNAENDEERDAAIKQIEDNIIGMFDRVKKAIEDGIALIDKIAEDMKGSENPTVQTIGKLMGGLASALEWFTEDNMNNVVTALRILADFWIAGKGLKLAGTVAELAANIKTISLFKSLGGLSGLGGVGGAAAGGAGAAITGSVITQAISASAGPIATAIATALTSTPRLIGVSVLMLAPAIARLIKGEDPEVKEVEKKLDQMSPGMDNKIENAFTNGKTALHALAGEKDPGEVQAPGKTLWESYIDWLHDGQEKLDEIGEKINQAHENLKIANEYTYDEHASMEEIMADMARRDAEEEETVSLDEKSAEAIADAIQDWWDAQRNAENGLDEYDEAWRALDWMQEVLGDQFSDVYDSIIKHLDEMDRDQQLGLEDIPANWWLHGDDKGEGITNENLTAFNKLPGEMKKAVKEGVSGIRVYLDGRAVGSAVADEVSRQIASKIGG